MSGNTRPTKANRAVTSYALVLAAVVLTTLVRLALNPLLGHRAALILYFPALVLSAWIGGWAGGLLAVGLSELAATYFFLSPTHSLAVTSHSDQVTLGIFAIVGLSVSALSNSQRKARQQAEDAVDNAKRAVDNARHAEADLRESETRKAAILEAALDCIIKIDERGTVVEWNPAAERTFGYSRSAALGQMLAELIIPASLRSAHANGIAHYLGTGDGPVLHKRIEVPALRADGTEFPVELAVVPIHLSGRTLFVAYLRDLTERERAAAQQRAFLRDVLLSVTEGRLHLCHAASELPAPLPPFGSPVALTREGGLRDLRLLSLSAAEGMAEERRHDLVTAVSEAGLNTITHGGGSGTGRVSADADGRVQVRIEDQGGGIELASLPKATLARGFSTKASLGHGFKMMQQVDRVYVLTGPGGTTVVLEQAKSAPLPGWL